VNLLAVDDLIREDAELDVRVLRAADQQLERVRRSQLEASHHDALGLPDPMPSRDRSLEVDSRVSATDCSGDQSGVRVGQVPRRTEGVLVR
jgi:hypothetical protein